MGILRPRQIRTAIALLLGAAGCTALGPPELKGQSGPLAWEVDEIVQHAEDGGAQLRWDYTVVLHNTGSRGIYLEQVEIGAHGRELYGGMGTERLGRRIEPDGTYRLTRSDSFGCPQCPADRLSVIFREGLTKVLVVQGLEDGGGTIRLPIRIPLNSSVGRR